MPSKLETAFKAGPVAKLDYTRDENLIAAYRFHRRRMERATMAGKLEPRRAEHALAKAREDVANGVRRYSASANGWNPRFEAYGEKHMRWIENPAACGLRFVGYADKLDRSIRHTGHFTDNGQHDLIRGVVFQLPGRDGKPLFIGGYDDPDNGAADSNGPVLLSFDVSEGERGDYWSNDARENDGARTAASWADSIAMRAAEEQREHYSAWCAGQRYAELGEEIAEMRREALTILAERRQAARLAPSTFPALCAAVRDRVATILSDIEERRDERAKLKGGEYVDDWIPGFWTGDDALSAAFEEGAASA